MNNILIPTDFSKNSYNSIIYALNYFEKSSCNFYLLHVTSIVNYDDIDTSKIPTIKTIEQSLLRQSKIDLHELLKKIKKKNRNSRHKFIPLSCYDYFIDCIRNQIKEKKIDLVVMGTKGASGIEKIIIGSNTSDLITKVKIPVMVVPEKTLFKEPKEIAFPTDYNIFYHTKIISDILEFTKKNNIVLRILHITKKDKRLSQFQLENKKYLDDVFATINHSFHNLTNKKIETGLDCFVENKNIDMIFMAAKNLTLFQPIMLKPTAKEISYHTKIPFIVLHE